MLRIINLVQRYKKPPSEVMGITDPYLAFCFDEAISHIQSFMYYDYEAEGKDKGKQKWTKRPRWIDDKKPAGNSELFDQMKSKLKGVK